MPSYVAKVEYVISTQHSYSRRTWTMNISGQFAGKTESAVMKNCVTVTVHPRRSPSHQLSFAKNTAMVWI